VRSCEGQVRVMRIYASSWLKRRDYVKKNKRRHEVEACSTSNARRIEILAIQVEVTLHLGQSDPGSWDVETANWLLQHCGPQAVGNQALGLLVGGNIWINGTMDGCPCTRGRQPMLQRPVNLHVVAWSVRRCIKAVTCCCCCSVCSLQYYSAPQLLLVLIWRGLNDGLFV